MTEQLPPGEALFIANHQPHDCLVVQNVIGHANDPQIICANLMNSDGRILAARNEVARLKIHTGLAQILQPLREHLRLSNTFADDVRAAAMGLPLDQRDPLFLRSLQNINGNIRAEFLCQFQLIVGNIGGNSSGTL